MIFASPNIPNLDVYLDLIPSSYALSEEKYRSTFTPVSQMKFMIDLP